MTGDDRRRSRSPAGEDPDDVRGLGTLDERRGEDDADAAICELGRVLLPDRHARRPLRVPLAVERPERARRLVVGAARRRGDDHRDRAAQAELEPDVVRPQTLDLPIDERHLPGHVEPVELPPSATADAHELPGDALGRRLGDAAERRALEARPAVELHERVLEPPRVDGNRLERNLREARGTQLRRRELGRGPLLQRPRHPKAERVGAKRLEPLDDVAEVLLVDPNHRAASTPSNVSRTSIPSVGRW